MYPSYFSDKENTVSFFFFFGKVDVGEGGMEKKEGEG